LVDHREHAAALTYLAVLKAPVVSPDIAGAFSLINVANGYASWKVLIPVLLTLSSGLLGANWVLVRQHADQPHVDAVQQREFERFVRVVERDLDDIKAELRAIRLRLESQ